MSNQIPDCSNECFETYKIGKKYEIGDGVEQSCDMAFEYYKKAADLNYAPAQYEVGRCYQNGHGVNQSSDLALEWYIKAANQGFLEAKIDAGFMIRKKHKKTTRECEMAFEFLLCGAQKGNSDCQYEVGLMYYYGEGTFPDRREGMRYLEMSRDNGNEMAKLAYERLYNHLYRH